MPSGTDPDYRVAAHEAGHMTQRRRGRHGHNAAPKIIAQCAGRLRRGQMETCGCIGRRLVVAYRLLLPIPQRDVESGLYECSTVP